MEKNEQTPDEYVAIADKVRSGEYFRDARTMLNIDVHEPMADRYWYMFITALSLIITAMGVVAFMALFPLKINVPFIVTTNNIIDDYPKVRTLLNYVGENPDFALRRHLIQHYVKLREEYDARFFDRDHNAVLYLSRPDVLKEYEDFVSPLNPYGPVAMYQRNTQRKINIISTEELENGNEKENGRKLYNMQVKYESVLKRGEQQIKQEKYKVDIAFIYEDISLDKETGKVKPYGFIVTSYHIESL
ncbi:MAG: VirB8/TrbF family protein [Rickettsiales bacterium]